MHEQQIAGWVGGELIQNEKLCFAALVVQRSNVTLYYNTVQRPLSLCDLVCL